MTTGMRGRSYSLTKVACDMAYRHSRNNMTWQKLDGEQHACNAQDVMAGLH